jgi:hypothetical protein
MYVGARGSLDCRAIPLEIAPTALSGRDPTEYCPGGDRDRYMMRPAGVGETWRDEDAEGATE